MESAIKFEKSRFASRMKTMLRVDFLRMFKSRTFYIILATALLVPVVMTVMLVMMDGQESTNPQTGEITIMEGPEYVWESFGTLPTTDPAPAPEQSEGDAMAAMGGEMDVLAMCNINLVFMGVSVFICLFISDDFRSGYAKNLFTVRAKKGDYIISKTLAGFVCGALMLILYTVGALVSGLAMGLGFDLVGGLTVGNLVLCMLAKIMLMPVFVAIFTALAVLCKQRSWLSICLSVGGGMILFMMIPMITPLTATVMHAGICLVAGVLAAVALGLIGKVILQKTSLV